MHINKTNDILSSEEIKLVKWKLLVDKGALVNCKDSEDAARKSNFVRCRAINVTATEDI